MIQNKLFRAAASVCLFFLSAAPLFGQAIFSVASSPTAAANIGVAELSGQIMLSVYSGTTVGSPLIIQYSAPVTNNSASEILISGTGGLAGIAPAPSLLGGGSNSILINVPAGGTVGNFIRIQGVRVALAGGHYSSVEATIGSPTGTGNSILAGRNVLTVINSILQPFTVDTSETLPLAYTRGAVTNSTSSFVITEGYASAFTSAIGTGGQTVPTSIRITPYPGIPSGLSVTFPSTITGSSGVSLTTTSGTDEIIPGEDGSTSVVYQFMAGAGSNTQVESFTMSVSMAGSTVGTGIINFQAALVPIGIAVPNEEFPSTDIPRYSELLVPDQSSLPGLGGSVQLAFPFRIRSDATYTGIALTNPLDVSVNVTLTPYDTTGIAVADPKVVTIPRKRQIANLASDAGLFGPNFNAFTSGTILAEASAPVLPGFYLLGDFNGSRLDGATADLNPLQSWVWPVIFRQAPAPFTTFELFNPTQSFASATLKLFDSNGTLVSTVTPIIPALGTLTQSIQQLFPLADLNSFSGGYVTGQSNEHLVARETYGNSFDSNVLPGQIGQSTSTFYWPHFASGGGYTTELTFINLDTNVTANLTLILYNSSGNRIDQTSVAIGYSAQKIRTIADLFPALPASQTTTGYVRVDINPTNIGPFMFTPSVTGSLRFSAADGSGSAALPLITSQVSDFVYSHVAEAAGYWTGVAILNTNSTPASMTLEVFKADGTSVGTAPLTLQPGEKIAKLLHELVPATLGQSGGWIHIISDQPVSSFSLFGSYNGLSLSAIPPQNIGN